MHAARTTMAFKDHFSGHSADYARFRPHYPEDLFAFVADLAPARDLVWDCATGNGQAARGLADHFGSVQATDASAEQVAQATGPEHVRFSVASAEASGLEPRSVDAVTVAQALHWFDVEAFYAEIRRVARPRAAVAVWCYDLMSITPAVDEVVHRIYYETVWRYWAPERKLVEEGYASLPFPFAPVDVPEFAMTQSWTLPALMSYVDTWSSCRRFAEEHGHSAVEAERAAFEAAWGEPDAERCVRWPLLVRAGTVTD